MTFSAAGSIPRISSAGWMCWLVGERGRSPQKLARCHDGGGPWPCRLGFNRNRQQRRSGPLPGLGRHRPSYHHPEDPEQRQRQQQEGRDDHGRCRMHGGTPRIDHSSKRLSHDRIVPICKGLRQNRSDGKRPSATGRSRSRRRLLAGVDYDIDLIRILMSRQGTQSARWVIGHLSFVTRFRRSLANDHRQMTSDE